MSDTLHNVAPDSKVLDFLFPHRKDVLHQRGMICFQQAIKNRAKSIATFQYTGFILLIMMVMPYNATIFVRFSEGAGFDWSQQLVFVVIAWILCAANGCHACLVVEPWIKVALTGCRDNINFALMNRWCAKFYSITPYYVLWCYLEQYPGMRRALVVVPTHIISDVYLGMVRPDWLLFLAISFATH